MKRWSPDHKRCWSLYSNCKRSYMYASIFHYFISFRHWHQNIYQTVLSIYFNFKYTTSLQPDPELWPNWSSNKWLLILWRNNDVICTGIKLRLIEICVVRSLFKSMQDWNNNVKSSLTQRLATAGGGSSSGWRLGTESVWVLRRVVNRHINRGRHVGWTSLKTCHTDKTSWGGYLI